MFCLSPVTLPLEPALEAALLMQKGIRKHGSVPRGSLEREASKLLAHMRGGIERLARRLEAVSQRVADLLRRGVLEPSLAHAFLMKRGGQQVPEAKTKAKGRTRGQAPTNEGAVSAPRGRQIGMQIFRTKLQKGVPNHNKSRQSWVNRKHQSAEQKSASVKAGGGVTSEWQLSADSSSA